MSRSVVCILTDAAIHAALCEPRRRTITILERGQVPFGLPDSLLVDHDPAALAAAIGEALAQIKEPTESVTLVVPMQWCLTQILPVSGKKVNPESLGYELEQYLPLPLEEVVCAFQPLGKGQLLAAAVPSAPMAALLEALDQRGVRVDRITLDTAAALQGIATHAGPHGVVLLDARWGRFLGQPRNSEGSVGVFGRNQHFAMGHTSTSPWQTTKDTDAENESDGWTIIELAPDPDPATREAEAPRGSPERSSKKVGEGAIDFIVTGACSGPGLNLRTGALAPGRDAEKVSHLAVQVLCLALLLLLVSIGGMHLRLRAIQQHLARVDQQRLAVYRQVFNTDRLPPGAALRLASERVRLEGMTRRTKDTQTPSKTILPPPLDVLRLVVAELPSDVRVMLTEARMEESQVVLRGQTVEHRDAERIVEAVNAAPGLEARPPRTTRLKSGGVEFSITAGPKNER